jgi:AraC family transcriptional regulator
LQIEIKNIEEYQVAFIFHKGSYEKIPELLGKVVEWLIAQDVEIQMPIYGTYYNSPMEVSEEDLQWEVGAAFTGTAEPEDDIKIKNVPEHEVVSTVFKGSYGEAASVLGFLIDYALKNGYYIAGPVTESYLNGTDEVSESELLTEVLFPVKKG